MKMIDIGKLKHVRLRNGLTAVVTGHLETADEVMLQGAHRNASCELWKIDGTWSHRDADHELDIVTLYGANGYALAINHARKPAAAT